MNELVSNYLKHAFHDRNKGEIRDQTYRQKTDKSTTNVNSGSKNRDSSSTKVTLYVSDNGTGIPEPIDIKSSKTLGLQLIKHGLVKLIKFRFDTDSP